MHAKNGLNEYEYMKHIFEVQLKDQLQERPSLLFTQLKEVRSSFSSLSVKVLKLQSRIEDKLRSPSYYIIISTYDQS